MNLGEYNTLTALRFKEQGCYLGPEGQDVGGVLLPNAYVPEGLNIGDEIEVFIYHDFEDRLIATTIKPAVELHSFAPLKVKDITSVGVFMDWGLPKNLFVPFAEQGSSDMIVGQTYVIFLYIDTETSRLVGSAQVENILDNDEINVKQDEEVDLIVYRETPLGYMAIINNENIGLIYKSSTFQPLHRGLQLKGYIQKIRDDNKIDLVIQKQGHLAMESNAQHVLDLLKQNNGFLPFTDKSDPEKIRETFKISKKVFKRAVGNLYKQRIVRLSAEGFYLIEESESAPKEKEQ
jgi:predicted RNA-binding protein (virulence factor B family)